MIYAVIAEAVIILALLALLYATLRFTSRERSERAVAYERSLQTMADRVQAPERLPVRDTPELVIPERVPDEWARVGEVSISDDYGLEDD